MNEVKLALNRVVPNHDQEFEEVANNLYCYLRSKLTNLNQVLPYLCLDLARIILGQPSPDSAELQRACACTAAKYKKIMSNAWKLIRESQRPEFDAISVAKVSGVLGGYTLSIYVERLVSAYEQISSINRQEQQTMIFAACQLICSTGNMNIGDLYGVDPKIVKQIVDAMADKCKELIKSIKEGEEFKTAKKTKPPKRPAPTAVRDEKTSEFVIELETTAEPSRIQSPSQSRSYCLNPIVQPSSYL